MTDREELKQRISTSSSRILLVGDLHLADKPPRNVTDSYTDDLFDLLEYLAKLEKATNADAVVIAGDVFNDKAPHRNSHRLVLRMIEAVKRFRRLIILPGNHDLQNDRLESVRESQPLGVLFEAGAEELAGWSPDLPLFGVPWQQRWFAAGILEEVFTDWRSKPAQQRADSLVVTHASIFPPGQAPGVYESLDPSDIASAMGGVGAVHYGHIHDYHGTYEVGGVTFCNPGALSRGSLTESNMQRGVKAALWTPEHGFYEIPLPARPAEEVFRIESAAAAKQHELNDEKFLEAIGSTRLEISSTAGVISHIAGLDESIVSREVKAAAIELLESVG